MNEALNITFNPIVDRMFIIVLALLFFVYGVTAITWIYGVVTDFVNWLRGKKKPSDEQQSPPDFLYEVQWGMTIDFEIFQTRIARSVEEAITILIRENSEGYIRYRPFNGTDEWPWGNVLYHDLTEIQYSELYSDALKAMRSYGPTQPWYGVDTMVATDAKGEEIKTDFDLNDVALAWPQDGVFNKSEYQNQLVDPVIDDTEPPKTTYIFEWANNPEFSTTSPGGIVERYLTKEPDTKVKEIIESLGSGYIRYRLANDTTDSWIPNGYVTKETLNNA